MEVSGCNTPPSVSFHWSVKGKRNNCWVTVKCTSLGARFPNLSLKTHSPSPTGQAILLLFNLLKCNTTFELVHPETWFLSGVSLFQELILFGNTKISFFCVHFITFKLDRLIKLYVFKSYLKKQNTIGGVEDYRKKTFFFSSL